MSNTTEIASAFIGGAPPGELSDVVNDIKTLTADDPSLHATLGPAFQKYNEEQLATTKLPGSSEAVLLSKYNKLQDGRYFDVERSSSWAYDHTNQRASSTQTYTLESQHADLIKSLLKSLSTYAAEHYPTSTYGVYPYERQIAILLVANKYSPANFWNGRWRATYVYDPSRSELTGTIQVNVHYYEDGNVALTTTKPISLTLAGGGSSSASEIVRKIAAAEKAYQEELNKAFVAMNEQSFKALRRQLPVTRQKVEWEKVGGYRLGSDLRGGAAR